MLKEVYRCLLVYNPKSSKKLHPRLAEIDELTIHWEERHHAALQMITYDKFDVLILDINIQDVENLALLKKYLSIASKIPVIVADECTDIELIKKFLLAGAYDYLQKGKVEVREIVRVIRHAIIRKEYELSQRESYRMIASFTNDWEYWENPDGSIDYVSPVTEKITHYSSEDFIHNPNLCHEIILQEDRQKFSEHKCGDQTIKFPRKTYFRIRRRDGNVRWIEHTCQNAFDKNGIYLGLRVTNRDMTELVKADEDLEQAEQKFQKLIETANDAIFISDVESGRITNVNQKACELAGYTAEELIGKAYYSIHPEEDQAFYKEFFEERLYKTATPQQNLFIQHRDGHKIPVEVSSSVTSFRGKTMMLDIYRDITERLESQLQQRKLSAAVEQSPASSVIMNTEGRIEYVNPKFTETIGYSMGEIIGQNWFALKTDHLTKTQYNEIWNTLNSGKHWKGELHCKRKDGSYFWEYTAISPIRHYDGSISHYLAVSETISERKEYEEKLLRQANYDALTNLPNRILMLDRLNQAIVRVKREEIKSAVLFIDLDHFKDVNDTLGHEMGDKLLIEVARRLQTCVRTSDTVSRLGGDEFLIILHNIVEEADASIVAQRVLDSLLAPVMLDVQETFISASIGITLCPNDGMDPQELIRNADAAMYLAKEVSRNAYRFFTNEMNDKVHKRMQLSIRLKAAIDKDSFTLLYQPVFEVKTKRIVGAEALIYWEDEQFGRFPPKEFIPIAEETNQILSIGKWMLHNALSQLKIWQSELAPQFRLSINISLRQLKDPQFYIDVEKIIKELKIDPAAIEFNIPEKFALNKNPTVMKNLLYLNRLGLRLTIDDFGQGLSSLSFFTQLSFRSMRLCGELIKDARTDALKAKLFKAILEIGKNLDLKIVSKGIDTKEDMDFTGKANCDFCLGDFFSNPMNADDFKNFISKYQV